MTDYEEIRHLDIRRRYFHISRLGQTLWSRWEMCFGLLGTVLWLTALFSLGLPRQLSSLIGADMSFALSLVLFPLPFLVTVIYAIFRTSRRRREVVYGFAELVTDDGVYISDGFGGMTRVQ